MARSHTDDKGTESSRLTPKVWTVGSIPATDEGFIRWSGYQTKKGTTLAMMTLYVNQLNIESRMLHEQQRKEQKQSSPPPGTAEAVPLPEPNEQSTALATEATSLISPIPKPQISSSPVPQISSSPVPQISSSPVPQISSSPVPRISSSSIPQSISSPASQISPFPIPRNMEPPPSISSPEQNQGHQNAPLNPNNLTMNQALELFELLQSRRSAEAVKPLRLMHSRLSWCQGGLNHCHS